MWIRRHGVQEDLFDTRVDSLLDAALNVLDRAGQVHGFDVVPRSLVRHDAKHVSLLLVDGCLTRCLLAEPAEILMRAREPLLPPAGAKTLQLLADLVDIIGNLRHRRHGLSSSAVPPAAS